MNTIIKRLTMAITVIGLAFGMVGVSFAQDLRDTGATEAYHPGLVTYRVGLFYQVKADHERAIAEFSDVIEVLPEFGVAYAARGDSYVALNDYEHALADYESALSIYPDFVSVLYARGRAYLALGETELAVADFDNAVMQMPEYALPYFGLGDVAFEQGDYGDALESYQTYLALVDDAPDALVLGRIDTLTLMAAAGQL
jgi:tetratricopeptide (TPR) repeat protein